MRLDERKTYHPSATEMPRFRMLNTAQAPGLDVTITAPDSTSESFELAFGDVEGYDAFEAAGDYTISAVVTGDTTETVIGSTTVGLTPTRYTTVIVGDSTAVQFVNLTDN
jgi:hypothetical protein